MCKRRHYPAHYEHYDQPAHPGLTADRAPVIQDILDGRKTERNNPDNAGHHVKNNSLEVERTFTPIGRREAGSNYQANDDRKKNDYRNRYRYAYIFAGCRFLDRCRVNRDVSETKIGKRILQT